VTSRGFRKAPVKKTRIRCSTIATTKTSAAQWWVWRTSRPALTSNEMSTTDLYASDIRWPRSGSYEPWEIVSFRLGSEKRVKESPGGARAANRERAVSPGKNDQG